MHALFKSLNHEFDEGQKYLDYVLENSGNQNDKLKNVCEGLKDSFEQLKYYALFLSPGKILLKILIKTMS